MVKLVNLLENEAFKAKKMRFDRDLCDHMSKRIEKTYAKGLLCLEQCKKPSADAETFHSLRKLAKKLWFGKYCSIPFLTFCQVFLLYLRSILAECSGCASARMEEAVRHSWRTSRLLLVAGHS